MLKFIKSRLNEASTWRGIAYLLTAIGVSVSPEQQEAILATGLSFAGLLHVFTKDTGSDK